MNSFLKKIIILFVVCSVISVNFFGVFNSGPKVAQAGWPTFQIGSIPAILQMALQKYLATTWTEIQQHYRDIIVAIVISKMQRDIVAQINGSSGGSGSGSGYINDWGQYLGQAATDIGVGTAIQYVNNLSNGTVNLCAPLGVQFQARLGILAQQYGYGGSGDQYYGVPTQCTFDDIKRNIENPNGPVSIFTDMGWSAFDALISPQVDSALAWSNLEDAVNKKIALQSTIAQTQAVASQGFTDNKVCTDQKALADAESTCQGDPQHDACVNYAVQSECTSWEMKTPGSVAAGAIMQAVGANFQYSSNVQSALAAILNALASRILTEGLNHVSSNGSQWSVSGTNQGINNSDIPQNIQNDKISANKQSLSDAVKAYTDVGNYVNGVLLPAVNADIALATNFNNTCSSSLISVDQGGGNMVQMTISSALDALNTFQQGFSSVASEASANLDTLNNLDYSDDSAVAQAQSTYNDFINNDANKTIIGDAQMAGSGQTGTTETMLSNFNSALSSFSCPAQ